MTQCEASCLQALKDAQITARQMVANLGDSCEGRVELLGMVSFLTGVIDAKVARHGDHDTGEPANENLEQQEA